MQLQYHTAAGERPGTLNAGHFNNMNIFGALSRISPREKVRVSVSIVYRIATGGYSWIWPCENDGVIKAYRYR